MLETSRNKLNSILLPEIVLTFHCLNKVSKNQLFSPIWNLQEQGKSVLFQNLQIISLQPRIWKVFLDSYLKQFFLTVGRTEKFIPNFFDCEDFLAVHGMMAGKNSKIVVFRHEMIFSSFYLDFSFCHNFLTFPDFCNFRNIRKQFATFATSQDI